MSNYTGADHNKGNLRYFSINTDKHYLYRRVNDEENYVCLVLNKPILISFK